MFLSDLQTKDIVNIKDGRRVGSIIDVSINKDGTINEISVQKRRFFIFSSNEIKIKWKQIDKIGKDVILVNVE